MLKKILSNTIVRLILAVLIGLLVGLAVNESVLKAVMIVNKLRDRLFLLGSVDHSRIRGAFYRPLESNASKSYYSL